MLLNARRYIFHHPEDDPLKGLPLPELRMRELVNPLDVGTEELGANAMFLKGRTQSAGGRSGAWAGAVPRSRAGRGR
jgi:hypothetical protein